MTSPPPLPGSRRTLPLGYSIPALSVGWPTFRRRRTLTRISRGLTKGGQHMPSTRALVQGGVLVGRLHEGFPTSPGRSGLTRLQHGGVRVHETGQVGTVQVSLGRDSAVAHVPALRERFLLHRAAVAALREPGPPGVQLDHLPASTRSQAGEERDKHPRGAASDRAPKLFLPRSIGDLLQVEGVPQRQHPMGKLPIAALVRGREPAVHLAPPCLDLPLALAHLPALLALLHATPLVIVVRVVGAPLPVKFPLLTAAIK